MLLGAVLMCSSCLSNESLFEGEPAYNEQPTAEFISKNCNLECVKAVIGATLLEGYACALPSKEFKNDPWMSEMGWFATDRFLFRSDLGDGNLVNLTASAFTIIRNQPGDHYFLSDISMATSMVKSEIRIQCNRLNGEFITKT
jgi:hypothetical protein